GVGEGKLEDLPGGGQRGEQRGVVVAQPHHCLLHGVPAGDVDQEVGRGVGGDGGHELGRLADAHLVAGGLVLEPAGGQRAQVVGDGDGVVPAEVSGGDGVPDGGEDVELDDRADRPGDVRLPCTDRLARPAVGDEQRA